MNRGISDLLERPDVVGGAREVRAVWIDNAIARGRIQSAIQTAKRFGFQIEGFASGRNARDYVEAIRPDVAIIDLLMPHPDGISVAQDLWFSFPGIRLAFVSSHLADREFRVALSHMDPRIHTIEIDKSALDGSPEMFYRGFIKPLRELVAKEPTMGAKPISLPEGSPFEVSYDRYVSLPAREMADLQRRAFRIAKDSVMDIWSSSRAQCVVLCGQFMPARWVGYELDGYPSDDELHAIGAKYGKAVFLFSRPIEADSMESSAWNECDSATDYYPSLTVDFKTRTGRVSANIHFDTGCPAVLLSSEYFDQQGIVCTKSYFPILGVREPDQTYSYREVTTPTILRDGISSIEAKLKGQLVMDWEVGPFKKQCSVGGCPASFKLGNGKFFCGKRLGLLGRSLLLRNGLTITIDGKKRRTMIG